MVAIVDIIGAHQSNANGINICPKCIINIFSEYKIPAAIGIPKHIPNIIGSKYVKDIIFITSLLLYPKDHSVEIFLLLALINSAEMIVVNMTDSNIDII